MKSPTSSVGRIDEDGILNGSATKERNRKTISRTGKKLFGYSIHQGSRASGARCLAKTRRSARVTAPVTTVARNRIRAKFIGVVGVGRCWSMRERSRPSLLADLQDLEQS